MSKLLNTVCSLAVDSISRDYFLCSSVRKNFLFISILSWEFSNSVSPSGSTSIYGSFAIFTTSAVISSTKVLNPSSMRIGISFFHVKVDILSSSCESCLFLIASIMENPFQNIFSFLCPDPTSSKEIATYSRFNLIKYIY